MSGTYTPPATPTPAPAAGTQDKTTTISKLAVSIIAEVTFLVCLGLAYLAKNDTAFNTLVGVAVSNATATVHYWIGSSSGSSAKDATIAAKGNAQ